MQLRDLDPVAAGSFRLVELLVGAAEEVLGGVAGGDLVGSQGGDSDRGADGKPCLFADREEPAAEAFRGALKASPGSKDATVGFLEAVAEGRLAALYDEAADVATTWIVMATASPTGRVERALAKVGRSAFLRRFLSHFDRSDLLSQLPAVSQRWLSDRNVAQPEREATARFLKQVGVPGPPVV